MTPPSALRGTNPKHLEPVLLWFALAVKRTTKRGEAAAVRAQSASSPSAWRGGQARFGEAPSTSARNTSDRAGPITKRCERATAAGQCALGSAIPLPKTARLALSRRWECRGVRWPDDQAIRRPSSPIIELSWTSKATPRVCHRLRWQAGSADYPTDHRFLGVATLSRGVDAGSSEGRGSASWGVCRSHLFALFE